VRRGEGCKRRIHGVALKTILALRIGMGGGYILMRWWWGSKMAGLGGIWRIMSVLIVDGDGHRSYRNDSRINV